MGLASGILSGFFYDDSFFSPRTSLPFCFVCVGFFLSPSPFDFGPRLQVGAPRPNRYSRRWYAVVGESQHTHTHTHTNNEKILTKISGRFFIVFFLIFIGRHHDRALSSCCCCCCFELMFVTGCWCCCRCVSGSVYLFDSVGRWFVCRRPGARTAARDSSAGHPHRAGLGLGCSGATQLLALQLFVSRKRNLSVKKKPKQNEKRKTKNEKRATH